MSRTVHTLFFSPTDGTARTVAAIANGFDGGDVVAHDLTLPAGRRTGLRFGTDDVVVFGMPVWVDRVPRPVVPFFGELDGQDTPAIVSVVYGNRDYGDALLELCNLVEQRGFRIVAAGAFVGEHSTAPAVGANRPDTADLAAAKAFGAAAAAKLAGITNPAKLAVIDVPGAFPYKSLPERVPMAPETSDACTQCAVCAEHCPTAAISFDDFKTIDIDRCVRCSSCVKRCPVSAKTFTHPVYLQTRERLTANFAAVRREAETYL